MSNPHSALASNIRDISGSSGTRAQERSRRRAQLAPGDEFRPHDIFREFGVLPVKLMATNILTALEKLCWVALSRRLGREGNAYPSYETLGRDIGTDRRQAMRLVRGLEAKGFLRVIARPETSNEYRLLWHPIFAVEEESVSGDILPPGGDDKLPPPSDILSPRGGDTVTPGGGDILPPKKNQSSEKSKKLASSFSEVLNQEIRERMARSHLSHIAGTPLNRGTIANIRAQIERLAEPWQAKQALELLEQRCREIGKRPETANSWGLVVKIATDAVTQVFQQTPATKKPWPWMTADERAAALEEEEKTA